MGRPTPIIQSLTENPNWIKKSCARCGTPFWVLPSKVEALHFCCKACRYESPLAVIEKHTTKSTGPDGCWICSLTPSSNYPCLKTNGEQLRASRIVLEASLGRPIAPGLLALHQCDNPRCVRGGTVQSQQGNDQQYQKPKAVAKL